MNFAQCRMNLLQQREVNAAQARQNAVNTLNGYRDGVMANQGPASVYASRSWHQSAATGSMSTRTAAFEGCLSSSVWAIPSKHSMPAPDLRGSC
jgi:hypothetical protein